MLGKNWTLVPSKSLKEYRLQTKSLLRCLPCLSAVSQLSSSALFLTCPPGLSSVLFPLKCFTLLSAVWKVRHSLSDSVWRGDNLIHSDGCLLYYTLLLCLTLLSLSPELFVAGRISVIPISTNTMDQSTQKMNQLPANGLGKSNSRWPK